MCNGPNLDFINIDACKKFDKIHQLILDRTQDIEHKQSSDINQEP